ncbi:unnamed protein product [Microthlaspi erraticum]|uniref:Uncharacterized protein n=1 Tax=Microthlaspi erraticum TaxID=1685480 RepID=A0A6D2KD49_9BRAS|nr:unnamed protein product [Microthlaspi erraticum]
MSQIVNSVCRSELEFSRLVSCLRPDETEDAIANSCQKLAAMIRQRPEQKAVFVTQHGNMWRVAADKRNYKRITSTSKKMLVSLVLLSSVAPEDVRQQHHRASLSLSANRTSTDKLQKLAEAVSDGFPVTQPEQVRPLLSLLEKEPPSRR